MFGFGKLKNYMSEPDQFLKKVNQEHPQPSASQQKEINKHARIHLMRDTIVDQANDIWNEF